MQGTVGRRHGRGGPAARAGRASGRSGGAQQGRPGSIGRAIGGN